MHVLEHRKDLVHHIILGEEVFLDEETLRDGGRVGVEEIQLHNALSPVIQAVLDVEIVVVTVVLDHHPIELGKELAAEVEGLAV